MGLLPAGFPTNTTNCLMGHRHLHNSCPVTARFQIRSYAPWSTRRPVQIKLKLTTQMPPRLFVPVRLFAAIPIAVCSMPQDFQSILGQTLQAPILFRQCLLQYHQRHYKAGNVPELKFTQRDVGTWRFSDAGFVNQPSKTSV